MRERGGKDLRTRSSLRLGKHHQIDFSPDNFWQMHRCETDMYDIEHLLVSHTHDDHFQFEQIIAKEMPTGTNGKPLHLYLSNAGRQWVERIVSCTGMLAGVDEERLRRIRASYPLHGLEHFREYDLGGLRGWTVRGNHHVPGSGEKSINYLLELPGGTRLLYALDTGYYEPATWEFLQGRNPEWVGKPFFAAFDSQAQWLDDLVPAFGEKEFFYEQEYEKLLKVDKLPGQTLTTEKKQYA